ncbi:MAG TPA: hypothetical protein VHK26_03010 [Methyloceanibacter sp.]|jgi:hypothetical protein|nr:hypothetical protein [Methyloceanibacter sp.]
MDLEAARKSLSKQSRFSPKKIAFGVVVCLVLVAGIALRASNYLGETPVQSEPTAIEAPVAVPLPAPEAASPPPAETTQAVPETPSATQQAAPAPTEPAEPAGDIAEETKPEGDAAGQTEQADLPGAGMILVSRKPVSVLASPSASAPAMFGFPAGRPFRVIGREGGFVRIQDLKSSASGWIDEAALAAPPPAPAVAAPSPSKPGAVNRKPATASADPKPKAVKKTAPVSVESQPVAEPDPAEAPRRPGLFGRGGLFGGIFGNGNAN